MHVISDWSGYVTFRLLALNSRNFTCRPTSLIPDSSLCESCFEFPAPEAKRATWSTGVEPSGWGPAFIAMGSAPAKLLHFTAPAQPHTSPSKCCSSERKRKRPNSPASSSSSIGVQKSDQFEEGSSARPFKLQMSGQVKKSNLLTLQAQVLLQGSQISTSMKSIMATVCSATSKVSAVQISRHLRTR